MEELGDATEYHDTANGQINEPTARVVRSAFKAQKPLGSREGLRAKRKKKSRNEELTRYLSSPLQLIHGRQWMHTRSKLRRRETTK